MMIGHPPDSIAAVQQAFIHIIILGGLQMLCPRILCSRTERETVKEEEETHFESSAMTSVIFQIYDDDDAS